MLTALTILHLFIAVILIVFVLLQDSKGDASGLMGGGGGGNRSVFGATGASNFLAKATRFLAAMFAVSCIALAYVTTSDSGSSVIDSVPSTELQRSEPAASPEEASADQESAQPTESSEAPSEPAAKQ